MSTQKALYLLELRGKFSVKDKDIPEPGPGEVLVQVHSTALNPIDWKIPAYGMVVTKYPAILGLDAAGVVTKLGAGVSDVSLCDKVFYQGIYDEHRATFQQYTCVPAELVAKVPSNLTFEQAATLPSALATAAFGLYGPNTKENLGLSAPWAVGGRNKYAGEPILVIGGASSVGQQVIQLAKISGFSPIITTASLDNEAYVKSLGATHVIDRNAPLTDLPDTVARLAGRPLLVAFDAVSYADTQNAAYAALAPGGKLVLVLFDEIDKDKLSPEKTVVHVFGYVQRDPELSAFGAKMYAAATALIEAGEIKPNKVEIVAGGLAGIPDALERFNKGVSCVKLVAHPQETV